jgi:hypothetical protein
MTNRFGFPDRTDGEAGPMAVNRESGKRGEVYVISSKFLQIKAA